MLQCYLSGYKLNKMHNILIPYIDIRCSFCRIFSRTVVQWTSTKSTLYVFYENNFTLFLSFWYLKHKLQNIQNAVIAIVTNAARKCLPHAECNRNSWVGYVAQLYLLCLCVLLKWSVCLSYVPLKPPFPWEIRNTRFIFPTSTRPKRHLDRFSRSIGLVNVSNIQTNWPIDKQATWHRIVRHLDQEMFLITDAWKNEW